MESWFLTHFSAYTDLCTYTYVYMYTSNPCNALSAVDRAPLFEVQWSVGYSGDC